MKPFKLPVLAVLLVAITRPGLAAEDYTVPRTQWGQPDLQGVWNFSSEVPMQRPEHFGDREFLTPTEIAAQSQPLQLIGRRQPIRSANGVEAFYNDNIWAENRGREDAERTSLIVYPANGRLPLLQPGVLYQPGGERDVTGQRPVRFTVGGIGRDGPEDRGLSERCLVGFNAGPQFTPGVYNNNVRIVQNRDHMVILTEMVHDARLVRLGNKPDLHEDIGLWSGDSRGYWEGDTLVVVTKNFNGLTQSFESYGSSKEKSLTERFTRRGPNSMDYQFTIEDPATFTDHITVLLPITRVPAELYEYACHEGNYGMGNMLRASRAREANAEMDSVANLFRP
ncbi:MAG: hypothetical protein O2948_00090 [Proteobacteria bacterium]|nr:hypothetical protein [Pseudomonadota bacterium]MDA0928665.1 hypothetical protein [Pseudomonadota bacterium]